MWTVRARALSLTLPRKPILFCLLCISTNNALGLCCHAAEIKSQGWIAAKLLNARGEIKLLTVLSREAPWWKSTVTSGMQLFKEDGQVHATALLRNLDTMWTGLWNTSLEPKLWIACCRIAMPLQSSYTTWEASVCNSSFWPCFFSVCRIQLASAQLGETPRRVLRASRKSCSHFNVYCAKSQVAQQTAIKAKGGPLRHQQVWPTGLANKFSLAVGPSTERGKPIWHDGRRDSKILQGNNLSPAACLMGFETRSWTLNS